MTAPATTKSIMNLTINGKNVEVKKGTTILQAARKSGVYIPTLCYVEKLNPIGSCRVCSVEVEGVDAPVMSCTTRAIDGMKITTDSESIIEYRKNMIQFILVNHPLDCPICERSGECLLQNRTYEFGISKHIWKTNDHKKIGVVDWNLLRYDKNLCILCERCVKICTEVQGVSALEIHGNGFESRIKPVGGETLDCDFCGQCWSVCPVGAIASSMIFPARSWEVEKVETVCPHCGVGCSYNLNTKKGKIVRVTSDDGIGNNNGNLCARGRFGYEFMQSGDRMLAPLMRKGFGLVSTDWHTALTKTADKLDDYKKLYGKNAFVGIGSERATNEDNYVFQKFFREVLDCGNIDNMSNLLSPDVSSGLFKSFDDFPMTCSFEELKEDDLFIFIGAEGSNENPVVSNHIREAIMGQSAEVAIAYSKQPDFLPAPKLMLTYDYTRMHEFLLAYMKETVENINAEGRFEGAVDIPDDWSGKLENAVKEANLDESLQAGISELVKLTRGSKRPAYLIGQEAQRHPQANAIVQNIVNLAKLTGGRVMVLREYCNTQGVNDMGVAPNTLPGYVEETEESHKNSIDILQLMKSTTAKALIIMDEDILRRCPDRSKMLQAIKNVEFVVVIDQLQTRTCLEADIVFPSQASAAKTGTFTNLEGRIQRINKAIEPVGDSQPPWLVITEIARAMGRDFGYKNVDDVTAEIAREVPLYSNIEDDPTLVSYKDMIKKSPALKWVDPPPLTGEMDEKTFIILPDHSLFALGLYTDYCPSLRPLLGKHYADFHLEGKPYVDFHPDDAVDLKLGAEDIITFSAPDGEWKGKVRISNKVKKGSIRVPDEKDQYPSIKLKYNEMKISCISSQGFTR